MNKIKQKHFLLFLKLEIQYLIVSSLLGVTGLLAYDMTVGIDFFLVFFIIMQPFLIYEYINRK